MGNGDTWEDYTPTEEGDGDFGREELRRLFADLGWEFPLPTSLADLQSVGEQLRTTLDRIDKLEASAAAGWGDEPDAVREQAKLWGLAPPGTAALSSERAKAQALAEKLYGYAGQYFGTQGQTIISRTLRPPVPDVAKLPTPEEFLGGYEEAYATHIEGLQKAGDITAEEVKFAYDTMRNESYQKYMARLGEFAKAGTSPFTMKEISREERGIGAGTAAGAALDKALGPGVAEPTTLTGTGEEVSAAMDKLGQGVGKEFTTVPRLSPIEFLGEVLSPTAIKIKYAGSPEGAGRTARRVPAGFVSSPRRV